MTGDELDLETGDNKGDDDGKTTTKKKSGGGGGKGPGRPSNDAKTKDRSSSISAELGELAEWIEKRDSELASTLKESAPRMAKLLAAYAARQSTVARVVDLVFSPTGPLALLRGFGPTMRIIGERLGARRDKHTQHVDGEGFHVDPETGLQILDGGGAPIRGDA